MIAVVQSLKQALQIAEAIVMEDGWEPRVMDESHIDYLRTREGREEIISITRKGDKQWQVAKEVRGGEYVGVA